jgi:FlaA1/EpsC-like NDP-sugar epimerase
VYGRTKALAEAMSIQAHYVNIRSGNVLWSSGSVLPIWKRQLETSNTIELTSKDMTRFFIHPTELALFILDHKDLMGTFIVPMKSFRLYDIAEEFIRKFGNKDSCILFTGLRPGERLHEFRDKDTSSEENICTDLNYIFQ